jgi:hypothetical protein
MTPLDKNPSDLLPATLEMRDATLPDGELIQTPCYRINEGSPNETLLPFALYWKLVADVDACIKVALTCVYYIPCFNCGNPCPMPPQGEDDFGTCAYCNARNDKAGYEYDDEGDNEPWRLEK